MAWIQLLLAGFFEVGFATCLKLSDNFSRLVPSILFFVFAVISFSLIMRALQSIPLGTTYAVWTGIGAAGTVVVGICFFNESASIARLFFLSLLIISIVGIKFVGE